MRHLDEINWYQLQKAKVDRVTTTASACAFRTGVVLWQPTVLSRASSQGLAAEVFATGW